MDDKWEGPAYEYGVTWGPVRKWWHSPNRRPLWQIPFVAVGLLLYWPAKKYVSWMEGQ